MEPSTVIGVLKKNSNYSKYEEFVISLTSINGYYVIPIVCLCGFVLNGISLIVLINPRFKERSRFRFIIIKIALCFFGCGVATGFQNYLICTLEFYVISKSCTETGTYAFQLYRLIYYKWIAMSLYVYLGINELFIIYDNYLSVKNIKNWFNNASNFKYTVLTSLFLTIALFVPALFAFSIKPVLGMNKLFYLEQTAFGVSTIYSFYVLCILGIFNTILVAIIIILSSFVLINFKKFLNKKAQLTANIEPDLEGVKRKRKAEMKIIKTIATMNILFALTRLTDVAVSGMYRLNNIQKNDSNFKNAFMYLDNFCYFVIYFVASTNFFVLYAFNEHFRKSFLHTIKYCYKMAEFYMNKDKLFV